MCKYSLLVKHEKGIVRYCHDCETYSLHYNNIVMNFNVTGYMQFKDNVSACYHENLKCDCARNRKDIYFNTRVEGLQFVFSTTEVGELLALLQEAELEAMGVLSSNKNDY